jgi:hypothetical protein
MDFEQLSFDDKVKWASGKLILAIGEGKFLDCLWTVCSTFSKEGFDRGIQEGVNREKAKH